jgi:hypothetical protein
VNGLGGSHVRLGFRATTLSGIDLLNEWQLSRLGIDEVETKSLGLSRQLFSFFREGSDAATYAVTLGTATFGGRA